MAIVFNFHNCNIRSATLNKETVFVNKVWQGKGVEAAFVMAANIFLSIIV